MAMGSMTALVVMGLTRVRVRVRVAEEALASSAFTFSDMYLDGKMSDNKRFTSRRSYDADDDDFVAAFDNAAAVAVSFFVDFGGLTSVVASLPLPLALMPNNSFSTSLSVASLSGEEGGWGALGSGPFAWPLHVRVDSSFFLVDLVVFFGMVEMLMGMPRCANLS